MPKLLAIDDNQYNLMVLVGLLEKHMHGTEVLTAQSGSEGLGLAASSHPDTVILDVSMPGMDGFEVCRRLKADEATSSIPVIMLTAEMKGPECLIRGLDSGADAFLHKPLEAAELVAQINAMLRIKQAEDSLRAEKLMLEKANTELESQRAQLSDTVERRTESLMHTLDVLRESERKYRELSLHIEGVREAERKRISREIHDELGQQLTALNMDIAWLATRKASSCNTQEIDSKLRAMTEAVTATIKTVQRIASELRPGPLDSLGLAAALEFESDRIKASSGLRFYNCLDLDDSALETDLSVAVFRVFQEAMTNVVRHAEARNVSVSLTENEGNIVLEVTDDGKGSPEERFKDPRAFGILGMRERAEMLGGTLQIGPALSTTGTTVLLKVPTKVRP